MLVVDDEPVVREFLLEGLAMAGHRALGAGTAQEALACLHERPFEAMLLDLMLSQANGPRQPEGGQGLPRDGLELLVKARIGWPDTAVIVVTALGDIETAIRAIRLGAYDYLIKPVSPGDVALRIGSAIRTRQHLLAARLAQQRLEDSFRQLEEMAELKNELMQMVVHDLKSPLASAMGYLELLGQKATDAFSERQLRYLQHAYASCKDVLRMSTTLLDLTRLEQGALELHREPLDLAPLLAEAGAEVEPLLAASGGTVAVACAPHVGAPLADREIVRRILGNLLANAAKYSPPGSHVRIEAQPTEDPEVSTDCTDVTPDRALGSVKSVEGGSVCISVADNGQGIPPEDQEAIFEKYYQRPCHRGMGGTGIGLAFCRMAVEAHGGTIWVESQPGHGSSFRFTLPLHAPSQETGGEDHSGR